MKQLTALLCLVFPAWLCSTAAWAFDDIKVTTWNIEHLGTDGRGFGGGYGGGNIPRRTDDQLKAIGRFIKGTLKSDVLALQEIGITHLSDTGASRSRELDIITAEMGSNWQYYLPPRTNAGAEAMYVGYLWNTDRVKALAMRDMRLPKLELAGKALFDRLPVIGYFEVAVDNKTRNDFVLVNVHLASGQDNDENHLIAMTLIEYNLNKTLKQLWVKETDRIILGDFNDNPYAKRGQKPKHSDALYTHMAFKGYANFVASTSHSTRMDSNLKSVIDHVLVNTSAQRHIDENQVSLYLPANAPHSFAQWRQTYSDHFPLSIFINVESRDDDAD